MARVLGVSAHVCISNFSMEIDSIFLLSTLDEARIGRRDLGNIYRRNWSI
jgi:hypothetical protein